MCRHGNSDFSCALCASEEMMRKSSIPLPGGGDTHIHPYGKGERDFTITTRIPLGNGLGSIGIHNGPDDDDFSHK